MPVKERGYPFIVKWGQMQGSQDYYIKEQIELAVADHAPANATSRNVDGSWSTTDDVVSNRTRVQLGLDPLPPHAPQILAMFGAEVTSRVMADGPDHCVYRFRFPTLSGAAYWAETSKITGEVALIGAETPGDTENQFAVLTFDLPVIVEYRT